MIFKNENEYLIHLLYCAIHDTVPEDVPENISLEKVFAIGVTHEVANIAYTAVMSIAEKVPAELLARWREFYFTAVKRDVTQNKARMEILTALHTHGIYTLEVQGTVVKQYYPQSHLRMMADLDFIIPAEKLDEAEKVMQELGYQTAIAHDGVEIQATKNQLPIEIHTEFFDATNTGYALLNHPYSSTVLHDDFQATVTDTVFYLFHLLHTIKHATEFMGIGIRRIIDLYYLEIALKDTADFLYIDGILKEHGLYDIKAKLLAVKDHWFCGAGADADTVAFENEIFMSGSQGTDGILYRNLFKQEQAKGKHFVKIRYLLGFLFPKKEDIYDAYPFCAKHHFLALLCWIYRWIFLAFNKSKRKNVKIVFSRLKIKTK